MKFETPTRHGMGWTVQEGVLAYDLWTALGRHGAGQATSGVPELADLLGRTPQGVARAVNEIAFCAHLDNPLFLACPTGVNEARHCMRSAYDLMRVLEAEEAEVEAGLAAKVSRRLVRVAAGQP